MFKLVFTYFQNFYDFELIFAKYAQIVKTLL